MHGRTLLSAVTVAALALTGCSVARPAPSQPVAPPPVSESETPTPVSVPPAATPTAQDGGPILTDARGALTMTAPDPNRPFHADRAGLYLFDLETGRPEFWTLNSSTPDTLGDQPGFHLSDDTRWVVARTSDKGFLADRTTGAVYQWDRTRYELDAVTPSGLLFEGAAAESANEQRGGYWSGWGFTTGKATSGAFIVLRTDSNEGARFTLPIAGAIGQRPALPSPDGKQVALLAGTELFLIDLATGDAHRRADHVAADRLMLLTGGKEFVAAASPGSAKWVTRKFDWSGKELGTLASGAISPDGSTTLRSGWAGDYFTPTVEVLDARTQQVQYRILGGDLCRGPAHLQTSRWTADSGGFMIGTKLGLYQVAPDGSMAPASHEQGHEGIPSPHAASLFADLYYADGASRYDTFTAGGSRKTGFAITYEMGIEPAVTIPLWHPSGKLLQLSLFMRGGHDGNCGEYSIPLPPKVEKPPFADQLKVQVQNTGDCLNVREKPERAGAILGCFKDGTVLTVVPPEGVYGTIAWSDDGPWARVRTTDGKVGWVSLKDGYLGWAK